MSGRGSILPKILLRNIFCEFTLIFSHGEHSLPTPAESVFMPLCHISRLKSQTLGMLEKEVEGECCPKIIRVMIA
jgi:hypothetical protein